MNASKQTSLMLGYLVGFIALVAPILGFIAPKGIAPLVISGGVFGFVILKSQGRHLIWPKKPIIVLLAALCIWAGISVAWSIDGGSAAIGTLKLAGNLLAGGLLYSVVQSLTGVEREIFIKGLLWGFLTIAVILAIEILLGHPVYRALKNLQTNVIGAGGFFWLNVTIGILMLLIWPVSIALLKKDFQPPFGLRARYFIWLGFIVVFLLALVVKFQSGVLALFCGLFAFGIIWIFGRRAAGAAAIVLTVVGLLLPFSFSKTENPTASVKSVISIPFSAEHRLKIWEFTAQKIDQKLFAGWGMNGSRNMPGGKTTLRSETGKNYGHALPLHPHNAVLQMWLELGLPGILIYLGLAGYVIMSTMGRHRSKLISAMMMGQFSTAFVIANLSFGAWQAWWVATLWLSAALMALAVKADKDPDVS